MSWWLCVLFSDSSRKFIVRILSFLSPWMLYLPFTVKTFLVCSSVVTSINIFISDFYDIGFVTFQKRTGWKFFKSIVFFFICFFPRVEFSLISQTSPTKKACSYLLLTDLKELLQRCQENNISLFVHQNLWYDHWNKFSLFLVASRITYPLNFTDKKLSNLKLLKKMKPLVWRIEILNTRVCQRS